MTRDAVATRARILSAATAEFAEHGLAGGRVDRIAAGSATNVRMIYAYFGGKEQLFDAAVAHAVAEFAEALPPRPDDLGAWAGEVFDAHAQDPTVLRLSLWAHLERPEAAREPDDAYRAKLETVGGDDPVRELVFAYALAQAWLVSPSGLLAAGRDDGDRARRRATVVDAVERIRGR